MFYILSIDGGGLRGVFPSTILNCISERLEINLHSKFDLIAGTSTGSIIAAAIAGNRLPSRILNLYRTSGAEIFSDPIRSWWPNKFKDIAHSRYQNSKLRSLLADEFTDTRMGDITKPLMIFTTDIAYGGVHVFKSNYSSEFTRDSQVFVRDAVLASCSAPVFFDPITVGSYLLADGGVWANNPTLAAIVEAQARFGVAPDDVRVLSLGTGHSRTAYGTSKDRKWGFVNGWKGRQFISFLLSVQGQSIHNYVSLLLKDHQLLRIDFESDSELPMDQPTIIDDLIARADREFTHQSHALSDFLRSE